MKKLLLILTAAVSFGSLLSGQSIDDTYRHAQALYKLGDYELAIPELRRVLFFGNNENPDACFALGNCYNKMQDYAKAKYFYGLAAKLYKTDSLARQVRFSIISVNLKEAEPNLALSQIFSLPDSLPEAEFRRLCFYTALAYYQLSAYGDSREYFRNASGTAISQLQHSVDSVYALAERNHTKSAYLPMMLSIIPGGGQLYLGETSAALNSFLLSAFFAGLYIYAIESISPLDAVLAVAPWFQRYYQGGMLQAKKMAVQHKEKVDSECYDALIRLYSGTLH